MSILASDGTKQTRVLVVTRRDGAAQRLAVAASFRGGAHHAAQALRAWAHFVVVSPRNIDILLRPSSSNCIPFRLRRARAGLVQRFPSGPFVCG